MQGFLFALGILIFGTNLLGVVVGSILLSVWSYIQPLLIAWVIFGNTLWSAIEKLWSETAHLLSIPIGYGKWILGFCVLSKMLLAAAVSSLAWLTGKRFEERYLEKLGYWSLKTGRDKSAGHFKNPWFILALVMSLGFFIVTNHPSMIAVGLYLLRIIALTLALMWVVRALPQHWTSAWLKRFPALKNSVDQALAKLSRT
jgi:hypothetical protein